MTIVRAGFCLALALAAGFAGALWMPGGVDPITVSPIAAPVEDERYTLHADGRDLGCGVTPVDTAEQARPMLLASECVDLVPGLAGAALWIERADGSVAFARTDGAVIAEFAVADGAAYESYRPIRPIMTLLPR